MRRNAIAAKFSKVEWGGGGRAVGAVTESPFIGLEN